MAEHSDYNRLVRYVETIQKHEIMKKIFQIWSPIDIQLDNIQRKMKNLHALQ